MGTDAGASRKSRRNRSKTNAPGLKKDLFKKMRSEYTQAFAVIDLLAKAVEELPQLHPDNPPRLYVTGRCIPDFYKGIPIDTLECTVYGVAPTELVTILGRYSTRTTLKEPAYLIAVSDRVRLVVTTARDRGTKESFKAGLSTLTPKDHLRTSDFTVESIAIDPLTHRWLDLYRGFSHLQHGILDLTDAKFHFPEDGEPNDSSTCLLPYRAAQIAATYNLDAAPRLAKALSSVVSQPSISRANPQDTWKTLNKLLLEGTYPEQGFLLLHRIHLLEHLFPSVQDLDSSEKTKVLGDAIFALCKIQEAVPGRALLASEHTAALLTAFLMPIVGAQSKSSEQTESVLEATTRNVSIPENILTTIRECLTISPETATTSNSVSNLISAALLAA